MGVAFGVFEVAPNIVEGTAVPNKGFAVDAVLPIEPAVGVLDTVELTTGFPNKPVEGTGV